LAWLSFPSIGLCGAATMIGNIDAVKTSVSPIGVIIMADLKARFDKAVADSKTLPDRPDNMTMLKIYALYKQASAGDVEGKRPGFTNMVARAKWDAWNEHKGKTADAAMQEYIDLIDSLK
jgi:diazepam-binding inhibitor (GABA receptor modulator, acyl-CoA-binding protein)